MQLGQTEANKTKADQTEANETKANETDTNCVSTMFPGTSQAMTLAMFLLMSVIWI